MTYEQAIAVRKRQIAQQPVDSHEVAMANRVIARTRGQVPMAPAPPPAEGRPVKEPEFVALKVLFLKLGGAPGGYDKCKAVLRRFGVDLLSETPRAKWTEMLDVIASQIPQPSFVAAVAPTFDTLCECSLRYGMHRVADFACPNPNWRPGNGQLQWLERKWKRA